MSDDERDYRNISVYSSNPFYNAALVGLLILALACVAEPQEENDDGNSQTPIANTNNANGNDTNGNDTNGNDTNANDSEDCTVLESEDVASGTTLAANSCYHAHEELRVDSGVLAIEEGVTLEFDVETALTIGSGATIDVQGESDNMVHISSIEDSHRWGGITLDGTMGENVINYAVIENAGRTNDIEPRAGVLAKSSFLTLTNSVLTDNTTGLFSTRRNEDDLPSDVFFHGNVVENSLVAPVQVSVDGTDEFGATNSINDNLVDAVVLIQDRPTVGHELYDDTLLPDVGVPYLFGNTPRPDDMKHIDPSIACPGGKHIVIPEDVAWTIEPGVTIYFQGPTCKVDVYGDLIAEGEENATITFSWLGAWDEIDASDASDIWGWEGIFFEDGESVIRHAEIGERYLRESAGAAITFPRPPSGIERSSTLMIEETLIHDAYMGIEIKNNVAYLQSCSGLEFSAIADETIKVTPNHFEGTAC